MKGFGGMVKQARKMQRRMPGLRQKRAAGRVEARAGGDFKMPF